MLNHILIIFYLSSLPTSQSWWSYFVVLDNVELLYAYFFDGFQSQGVPVDSVEPLDAFWFGNVQVLELNA